MCSSDLFIQRNGGVETRAVAIKLNSLVSAQASVLAYADTARFVAVVSLLLAPLAFILKRPPKQGPLPAGE